MISLTESLCPHFYRICRGIHIDNICLFSVAPYGVYVIDCLVADTVNFDTSVVNLIQNG